MDNNNFPDIDGLLGSIRNVATPVGHAAGTTTSREAAGIQEPGNTAESCINTDTADPVWEAFMENLSSYGFRERKDERKVCMIDKDIADSLDECDIDRKCRSDVINAIVRTFITAFLPRLRTYRKKNKSLLDKNDNI
ncbi:hypothetical protein [Muribaculum intestinale]|jgi:DNA-binding ferritin-like protein (Dps family)|uniref:Uncharacterized protein n=1 Tax=Muribaculum intestinale TaxID=1796646 RepID=A0A4S2FMN5_9BACT|nr:hypothetical protein [Muribaculum intestinale]MYM13437.1 hypothetical protein [Muribaculum intestinale]TGY70238.1 hypothetical protein E5333_12905 [Muribaculum intestinale]